MDKNWKIGYLFAVITNITFVGMQIFFKFLSPVMEPARILQFRSFFLMILNTYFLVNLPQYAPYQTQEGVETPSADGKSVSWNIKDPKVFRLAMKRLIWNTVTVSFFLYPLKYIEISIANAVFNTGPLMVFFVEAIYFQKPLNYLHFIFTVLAFIGILLILNPTTEEGLQAPTFLYCLPLLGAFTNAMSAVYLRDLKGKIHQTIVLQNAYLSQLLYNSLTLWVVQTKPLPQDQRYFELSWTNPQCIICMLGVCTMAYIAHRSRVRASFILQASRVMAFNYLTIVFSLLADFTIFDSTIGPLQILGVFVTSAGLLSGMFIKKEIK